MLGQLGPGAYDGQSRTVWLGLTTIDLWWSESEQRWSTAPQLVPPERRLGHVAHRNLSD